MPTRITFRFFGEAQLDRTLDRIAEDVGDVSPAWEVIADRFAAAERKQFDSEGAYGSGGWAPLSEDYGAWKANVRPGAPILVFDGELRKSLTERPFGVEVIGPDSMVIGSDVEYGLYHQQGTDRMPRRRPVELPENERRQWVRILQRFIITGYAETDAAVRRGRR